MRVSEVSFECCGTSFPISIQYEIIHPLCVSLFFQATKIQIETNANIWKRFNHKQYSQLKFSWHYDNCIVLNYDLEIDRKK